MTKSSNILLPKPSNICASNLNQTTRQNIGVSAFAGRSITDLSCEHSVSRKFVYTQKDKVSKGLSSAFCANEQADDKRVLFTISVTKQWLRTQVISLALNCRSSYRRIISHLLDTLGIRISIGSIHNILSSASKEAQAINSQEDLSNINVGSHDEMFHAGKPILTGIDLDSAYCYLLEPVDQRDAQSWGIHLLDCVEKGLSPEYTVADFGTGLRAGQSLALPDVPCFGDVFHALQEGTKVLKALENHAYRSIRYCGELTKKMAKAIKNKDGRKYGHRLSKAKQYQDEAIELYDSLNIILGWLRCDILAFSAASLEERQQLYDFFLTCLREINQSDHRLITKLLTFFTNNKTELLMFAQEIDKITLDITQKFHIAQKHARQAVTLQYTKNHTAQYQELDIELRNIFKKSYHRILQAVKKSLRKVFRASSMVENLNGRLRKYFSLRQNLGKHFLPLLRFFFNHRNVERSRVQNRQGKTPREALTGISHAHWLDMLGFETFSRA